MELQLFIYTETFEKDNNDEEPKKMRKRILSMLCSIAILCTLLTGTAFAQEEKAEPKMVDGSYLTHEDRSDGTSVPEGARGEYMMQGACSISKAGLTRIYAYASTTATQVVNYMATIVYVERYNAEKDAWGQVHYWIVEDFDDYYMSTDAAVVVEPGYYYRVRAIHIGGDEYPYEETYSVTNGIYVPPLP